MSAVAAALTGLFAGFLILEALAPLRGRRRKRTERWFRNGALGALGAAASALLAPLGGLAAAQWAQSAQFGLLNQIAAPAFVEIACAILLLDFALWAQHWATHKIPLLWRLHRTHHSDPDLDATSALRFHPGEIALSTLYKALAAAVIGADPAAVAAFAALVFAGAVFNHSNLELPRALDRGLRLLLVTPAMHQAHHAPERARHDRNFGTLLSLWDRLFGLYDGGPLPERVGLAGEIGEKGLTGLLLDPVAPGAAK